MIRTWCSENGRFYVGQLDRTVYLILLDLKQTNHGGVLGQVSGFNGILMKILPGNGWYKECSKLKPKAISVYGKEPDDNGLLYLALAIMTQSRTIYYRRSS